MTAQRSDRLVNSSNVVDFGELRVYAVATGDIRRKHGWGENYPFVAQATPDPNYECSALWRGYVRIFELDQTGRLVLRGFEYPYHPGRAPDALNEVLTGDFWLVLKPQFFAPRTYVPFRDGVLVADRSTWVIEKEG